MTVQKSPGVRSALDPRLAEAVRRVLSDTSLSEIDADYLEVHDPRFVGRISDKLRRILDSAPVIAWRGSRRPSDLFQFVTETAKRSKLSALVLSTSASGYVREAAVQRIESIPGPFSLALLVNRLNDWVPNVRAAAEARLSEMSARLDRGLVAGCIEYLWRFDEYGRASSAGREIIAGLIDDDAAAAAVREWVLQKSDDRSLRLAQHLLRSPALDDLLIGLATRHKHPRLRALAAKAALEGVFSWRSRTAQKRSISVAFDRAAMALSLLKDRSADVQHHALQHLSQNLQDRAALDHILKRYLLHPRQKLSETAQWRLGKLGVDWLAWVRQEFEARPLDVALARLLVRVGAASDGERLWSSAQRAPERTRLAFLLAAARLQQADAIEEARVIALHDPDLARARAASAALLDGSHLIAVEDLITAASAPDTFARRGFFAHAGKRSLIDQLRIFCRLEACGHALGADAFDRLGRRANRGRFDPTAAQLEELRQRSADCPRVANWMRRLQLM